MWFCKSLAYIRPAKNPAMNNLLFPHDSSQAQLARLGVPASCFFFRSGRSFVYPADLGWMDASGALTKRI